MKPANIAAVSIFTALLLFTVVVTACNIATPQTTTPVTQGKGFAVLELFTSEGCSSCPPADALLARIQQSTDTLPVYVINYRFNPYITGKRICTNHYTAFSIPAYRQ